VIHIDILKRLWPHHAHPQAAAPAVASQELESEIKTMFDYKAVVHSILAGHKVKAAVDLGFNVVHQIELAVSGVVAHPEGSPEAAKALEFVQTLFRGYDGPVLVQTDKQPAGYVADILLAAEQMLLPPTIQVKVEDGMVDLAHELLAHGHALASTTTTSAAPAPQSTSPAPAQQPASLPTAGVSPVSTGPTP
jgi:hypothetical protein